MHAICLHELYVFIASRYVAASLIGMFLLKLCQLCKGFVGLRIWIRMTIVFVCLVVPGLGVPRTWVHINVGFGKKHFLFQQKILRLPSLFQHLGCFACQVYFVDTNGINDTLGVTHQEPTVACIAGLCIAYGQFVVLFLQSLTRENIEFALHLLHLTRIDELRVCSDFPLPAPVDFVAQPLALEPGADVVSAVGGIDGIALFVVESRRDTLQPLDSLVPLVPIRSSSSNCS